MKTAIIILNYNNWEDTINCIRSVEKFNTASIKYIVVDNGSTRKNAIENLDSFFRLSFSQNYELVKEESTNKHSPLKYLTFFVSMTNDGYAQGNNKGLKLAYEDDEIDKVMILNNDILFIQDIIPKLVRTMEQLADCAIISPILYKKEMKDFDYNCARIDTDVKRLIKENFLHYWYQFNSTKYRTRNDQTLLLKQYSNLPSILPIELPSGSCMLIKKNIFKQIGSFDPHTFLYYEENILFKKIEKIGLRNYMCTRLKCIHLGASSTSSSDSFFIRKCCIKSMRYYVRMYSGCSRTIYFLFYLSTIFYLLSFRIQKRFSNH